MTNDEPKLDIDKLLEADGDMLFEDFTLALGRLMAHGLSQQSDGTQIVIHDAMASGGSLAAVVGLDPVVVTGLLIHPGQPNLQLFQISRGAMWTHH